MSGTDIESPMGHRDDTTPDRGPVNLESQMKDLHDAIWKEGKPFVTNEGGVDILVDTLGAIAPQPLVMVRSEYPQIFQHILDLPTWSETHAGLVVTGHQGVGKTLFLYYALGAALAAHMPVALYERDSLCLFFDDIGVHKIHDIGAAEFPPRTLFLVDSNSNLHSPPGPFLDHRLQGVIVQATSPDTSRWRSWAKEVSASYWLSAPWKREEILALQRVTEALGRPAWVNPSPGTAVYTPVDVFDLLGPSPRTCMRMAGRVKSQDEPLADFADHLALPVLMSDLETVLRMVRSRQAPPECYYDDNNVDRVFFLYNASGSNPTYDDAPKFCYGVPTLFLCRMLCANLRSQSMAFQLHLASISAHAPSIAAPFYQPLALDLLLDACAVHTCHVVDPDGGRSTKASFRIGPNLSLRAAPLHFDCDSDTPTAPVDDNTVIVVPPAAGSPSSAAFHALVVSEKKTRVTLLRMVAIAGTPGPWPYGDFGLDLDLLDRDRDREGIRSAIDALSKVLPRPEEVRWSLVYVALRSGAAKKAAKGAEAREMLGELRRRVAVGWLELQSRGDKDTKALLNALEKRAQEAREVRELWRPRVRVAQRLGNDTAGSSAWSLATQEKGIIRSSAARTKSRHCSLLPCLNL